MLTKRPIRNLHIYVLKDPETDEIRYVGATNDLKRRLNFHLHPAARDQCAKTLWVKSLTDKGLLPIIESIERVDEDTCTEREMFWIQHYRTLLPNLTNSTAGGKGSKNPTQEVQLKRANYHRSLNQKSKYLTET